VNGDAITEPGPRGERITDADFILLLNAHSDVVSFRIPPEIGSPGVSWQVVVNTGALALALAPGNGGPGVVASGVGSGAAGAAASLVAGDAAAGYAVQVGSRAMVVLRGTRP
jgi:hypothetical protein